MIPIAGVLMVAVVGATEKPARIVETNGVPTILINKVAKGFKVGRFEPGETYTTFFAKTNAAGEVAEVSAVPSLGTIGNIFSSRVGMRYVPSGGAAWSATGETPVVPVNGSAPDGQDARRPSGEILREVPECEVPPRLGGWERPRFVVLEAKTLEVRGVFSISDELADAKAARDFFEKTLLKELVGFFGEKHPLYPLGKNEFAFRHNDERGNELEMRIKGFMTDAPRIRYIIYHGRPYASVDAPGAMDAHFYSIFRQSGFKFSDSRGQTPLSLEVRHDLPGGGHRRHRQDWPRL